MNALKKSEVTQTYYHSPQRIRTAFYTVRNLLKRSNLKLVVKGYLWSFKSRIALGPLISPCTLNRKEVNAREVNTTTDNFNFCFHFFLFPWSTVIFQPLHFNNKCQSAKICLKIILLRAIIDEMSEPLRLRRIPLNMRAISAKMNYQSTPQLNSQAFSRKVMSNNYYQYEATSI